MRRQPLIVGLVAALGITLPTFAQWPQSADTNLVICNHASEQVLPKIAATSDGGCYISWFDLASGNYDVYLQRLDGSGIEQWPHNGLLISNHAQETWLTDYDMTVDAQDHAIVTFNDVRAGGDWDIYAYRISLTGDFVWGPDGIAISDNADFEPDPRVCATSGGNIVFAWQQETPAGNVINLRKLSPAGQDVWSPPLVTLTSTYGLSIPRLARAENDRVILQYLVHQGTQYWSPKHIYAQKFDSLGVALWEGGAVVSNAGGLGPQMRPDILPDGVGGVYSYWYDSHEANQLHAYAQHVLDDGTPFWTANGVRASLAAGELQMSPSATVASGTGLLMLFYQTANTNQSLWGVGGQTFNASGVRQWGDNGVAFAALNDQQRFMINAGPQPGGAVVAYLEYISGSAINNLVKAFRTNSDGLFVWPDSPRTLSSVVSSKGRLVATVNNLGQFINAWSDQRSDAGDIYLQNINPDGTLGSYGPPLPAIAILSPDDSLEFSTAEPEISVAFTVSNFMVQDSGGDGLVEVRLNGTAIAWLGNTAPYNVTNLAVGWNRIDVELVNYQHQPLNPQVMDSVHVHWQPFSADDPSASMPTLYALHPAYPNPFNPQTRIAFDLPRASFISLTAYNLAGQEVATLVATDMPAGRHTVTFDASRLPSSLYFCELKARDFRAVNKMILMK